MKNPQLLVFLALLLTVFVACAQAAPHPLPIVNPSFEADEDGSWQITGWAPDGSGSFVVEDDEVPFSPSAAYDGSRFVTSHIDSGAAGEWAWEDRSLTQVVDLLVWEEQIADGLASLTVTTGAWAVSAGADDRAMLAVRFQTGTGQTVGDWYTTPPLYGPNVTDPVWHELSLDDLNVPTIARRVEIELRTIRTQGVDRSNNAGFDAVSAEINIVPEPATLMLLCAGTLWVHRHRQRCR